MPDPSFNSTLVRLKREEVGNSTIQLAEFQFHIGSIKTPLTAIKKTTKFRFNSTLVRLKH